METVVEEGAKGKLDPGWVRWVEALKSPAPRNWGRILWRRVGPRSDRKRMRLLSWTDLYLFLSKTAVAPLGQS